MDEPIQRIYRLTSPEDIAAICRAHGRNPKPAHTPRLFIGSDNGFWVLTDEYRTWDSYGGEHATPESLAAFETARTSTVPSESGESK